MTRSDVYKIIDSERKFQDSFVELKYVVARQEKSGRPAVNIPIKETYSIEEEVLHLMAYAMELPKLHTHNAGSLPVLEAIRKIAALCVRTMEQHETPARQDVMIQ